MNMKVYHIINSLNFGGAERLVIDLSKQLSNIPNLEVHIIAITNSTSLLKNEHGVNKNVFIHVAPFKSPYDYRVFSYLTKKIKNADVIHLHLFPSLYWGVLTTLFRKNRPLLIYTEHSTKNRRRSKWYFKFFDKLIYKRLDKIACISESTRNELILHIGDKCADKIEIIFNGVDLSKFRDAIPLSRESFGLSNKDFVIIQIASFRPAKDQITLLRCLPLLPNNFKAIFVGDGKNKQICERECNELSLNDRVLFLGSRNDISSIIKVCDVVVVSSIYEGFGLAAVEGMASNLPVVGSNVPGLSEVIKDYGLLFEARDFCKLAGLLRDLYSNTGFYDKIRKSCFARSEDFSISVMAKNYFKLYNIKK